MNYIDIHTDSIRLDQALKLGGVTGTGGESKYLIQEGHVLVNQETETRRGRKLKPGDAVEIEGEIFQIRKL